MPDSGCHGRNTPSNHSYRTMSYWGIWQTFALQKPTDTTKASLLSPSLNMINKATCTSTPATSFPAIKLLSHNNQSKSSQCYPKLVSLLSLYLSASWHLNNVNSLTKTILNKKKYLHSIVNYKINRCRSIRYIAAKSNSLNAHLILVHNQHDT